MNIFYIDVETFLKTLRAHKKGVSLEECFDTPEE